MPKIPKGRCALPLAATVLLLTGCAHADPNLPPESRFRPAPLPTAPVGEARCDDDGDGTFEPCLSQRQSDELFNQVIDAACERGNRLAWLLDYFHDIQLPPECGPAR